LGITPLQEPLSVFAADNRNTEAVGAEAGEGKYQGNEAEEKTGISQSSCSRIRGAYERARECLDFLVKIGVGRVSAYGESTVESPIANTLIELVEREGLEPSTPAL